MVSGHTKLFGSTSYRTLGCPAHYKRGLLVPDPPSSSAAEEGTMLHGYCEQVLLTGSEPEHFDWWENLNFDQQNIVKVYVGTLREIADGVPFLVEHRTKSPHLHPEWFGTADGVVVKLPRLTIVDLKCGRVPVVPEDQWGEPNPQLGSYAISVLENFAEELKAQITEVEFVIVQPREGGVKRALFRRYQLEDLKKRLLDAAALAESDNPPASVGDHCHFCKVKPVCPTYRDFIHDEAKLDFVMEGGEAADLSLADLESVLAVADMAIEWGNAVKQEGERRLNDGTKIPGWQLVPKRGKRVWKDERVAKQRLLSEGLNWHDISVEALKSPAQVETIAKKQGYAIDLTDIAESVSSGLKISKTKGDYNDDNDDDDNNDAGW